MAAALKALETMNLYQEVWPISYRKTAYVYGGFGVQNSDGEYNDARQAQFGATLCDFGAMLHRQDLFERGVAATRAALTLISHPLHDKFGIYPNPNYPLGLEPENDCHGGWDHQAGRTGFDWGEGSGLTSMAWLIDKYGQAYADPKGWSVGIDGVVPNGAGWSSCLLSDWNGGDNQPRSIDFVAGDNRALTQADFYPRVTSVGIKSSTISVDVFGSESAAFDGELVQEDGATLPIDVAGRPGPLLTNFQAKNATGWFGKSFKVRGKLNGVPVEAGPYTEYLNPAFDFTNMRDWAATGNIATIATNSRREDFGVPAGTWFIGTCEDGHGGYDDAYTGTITSPIFYVSKPTMKLLVGGGQGKDTYVELVDADTGKQLAAARGKNDERMSEVSWDVSRYSGHPLRIRAVDNDSTGWGHINVASIRVE
jgi:hypothetical protein